MTAKRQRQPPIATVIGEYHDRIDLIRDAMGRDLFARLDMGETENAQIRELTDSLVNCLKVLRIQRTGYDPDREDTDAA